MTKRLPTWSDGFTIVSKTSFPSTGATDETDDEDINKEYVEETNRDAVMIAAAKVVATEAVPKVSYSCSCKLIIDGSGYSNGWNGSGIIFA